MVGVRVGGLSAHVSLSTPPIPAGPLCPQSVSRMQIHTHVCVSVCRCRAHPPRRTTLGNKLGPEAGTALAKAVEVNSSLARLALRRRLPMSQHPTTPPPPCALCQSVYFEVWGWLGLRMVGVEACEGGDMCWCGVGLVVFPHMCLSRFPPPTRPAVSGIRVTRARTHTYTNVHVPMSRPPMPVALP